MKNSNKNLDLVFFITIPWNSKNQEKITNCKINVLFDLIKSENPEIYVSQFHVIYVGDDLQGKPFPSFLDRIKDGKRKYLFENFNFRLIIDNYYSEFSKSFPNCYYLFKAFVSILQLVIFSSGVFFISFYSYTWLAQKIKRRSLIK